LTFDRSLLRAISRPLVLLEQLQPEKYTLNACVRQFDIVDFDQVRGQPTKFGIDLALEIYLTAPILKGRANISYPTGAIFYDGKPRLYNIMMRLGK
jgi:hypothetical protein